MTPIEMTPAVMQDLERRNLIVRLCPHHHELDAQPGETRSQSLYESDPRYGGHKLITVTVNRTTFAAFGTHPDNEEFLLIGDPATTPMYLAVALHMRDELQRRIAAGQLSSADFVCLHVKYNDPEVSFFTMLKDVPHGEAIADAPGRAPSFYVTEPTAMGLERTAFGDYQLAVG